MCVTTGKAQIQTRCQMVLCSDCAGFMWVDSSVVRVENAGEMPKCLGFSLKLLQQRKRARGRGEEGEWLHEARGGSKGTAFEPGWWVNSFLCHSFYFCTGLEIFMNSSKGRRCPGGTGPLSPSSRAGSAGEPAGSTAPGAVPHPAESQTTGRTRGSEKLQLQPCGILTTLLGCHRSDLGCQGTGDIYSIGGNKERLHF